MNNTAGAGTNMAIEFNFNKSCIWIKQFLEYKIAHSDLTLTRVVFEWKRHNKNTSILLYLTLTRVVFEFNLSYHCRVYYSNLTLTSVVFEYKFT